MVKPLMFTRIDTNRLEDIRFPMDPRPIGKVLTVTDSLAFLAACSKAVEGEPCSTTATMKGNSYRITVSHLRMSIVECRLEPLN